MKPLKFSICLALTLTLSLCLALPSAMSSHGGGGGGGGGGESGGGGTDSGGGLPGMSSRGGISNTRSTTHLSSTFSDLAPAPKSTEVNPYRGSTPSKSGFMQAPEVFDAPEANDSQKGEDVLSGMGRTLETLNNSDQMKNGGLAIAPGMGRVTPGIGASPQALEEMTKNLSEGAGGTAVGKQPGAAKALAAARLAPPTAAAKKAALLLGNSPESIGTAPASGGAAGSPKGESTGTADNTGGSLPGPKASEGIAELARGKAMPNKANVPAYTPGLGFGLRK